MIASGSYASVGLVFTSVSVIAISAIFYKLRSAERRAAEAERRAAEAERKLAEADAHASEADSKARASREVARLRAAAGAREMMASWDTQQNGFVVAKDVTDIIRGRRDPSSPWAQQKSKWPPQRMEFLAERFADGKRFGPAQLEDLCAYLQSTATNPLSDELHYAWEQVERLRHKTGSRESLVPVTQFRGLDTP